MTTNTITPISKEEFHARQAKARTLMTEAGVPALLLEAGTSLYYFTGVQWARSERLTGAILLATGETLYITPAFERDRLANKAIVEGDIHTWHEHENPCALVAELLKKHAAAPGPIGIESQTRFFITEGLRRVMPEATLISADPITIACRSIKSAAEIALMQRAMDLTVAAYKKAIAQLREGITRGECLANAAAAHRELGVTGGIDFQFGSASSYPHGGPEPQVLREGDVVQMDGGCGVEGYRSDISRAIIFGEPSAKHREIWELEKAAQAAAFAAAQLGAPCEAVDAAARKVIVDAGLGPDYSTPGLPHRTGHGLGLDIHEPENMVRGNSTPLAPGMCFTNEPMIVFPGEFGIRLEDCIYMTDAGPQWFTQPSPAIDQPFV